MPRNQNGISNGESGLSVRNKLNSTNDYISTYIYGENDWCYYNGKIYISLQDNNLGHALTDNAWWEIIATNKIIKTFGIEIKTLDSFVKTRADSVIYDYKIKNTNGNIRAGNIVLVWDIGTGSIEANHYSKEIGDTSAIIFEYAIVSNDVIFRVNSTSANWSFTAIRRFL